jgi:hypothetical protein
LTTLHSNEEFFAALRPLIERWCDERRLDALAKILPGYLAFNGLTDGWHELKDALKAARGLGPDAFSPAEWDTLNDLIHAAELAVAGVSDCAACRLRILFARIKPVLAGGELASHGPRFEDLVVARRGCALYASIHYPVCYKGFALVSSTLDSHRKADAIGGRKMLLLKGSMAFCSR